jgi:hypothetical protein
MLKQWQNLSSLLFLDDWEKWINVCQVCYVRQECMPRCAVHIPPFGVDIAIFGISFTLRSLSCSRHHPRNPRGSDRHHSACITLSYFLLALPLPSTPTSFLLSFARFITNHIPLLSGRYLPRHLTSRAYNLAKHLNFISIPLLLSTSLTFYCFSVPGLVSLYILQTSIILLDPSTAVF